MLFGGLLPPLKRGACSNKPDNPGLNFKTLFLSVSNLPFLSKANIDNDLNSKANIDNGLNDPGWQGVRSTSKEEKLDSVR